MGIALVSGAALVDLTLLMLALPLSLMHVIGVIMLRGCLANNAILLLIAGQALDWLQRGRGAQPVRLVQPGLGD